MRGGHGHSRGGGGSGGGGGTGSWKVPVFMLIGVFTFASLLYCYISCCLSDEEKEQGSQSDDNYHKVDNDAIDEEQLCAKND